MLREEVGTYLWVLHVVQRLLVGRVRLLEVVNHEVAVTWDGERSRISSCAASRTRNKNAPRAPQMSPASGVMVTTRPKYSAAFPKSSFERQMAAIWDSATTE